MTRPTTNEVSDRALVLYALVRRGYVEHILEASGGEPGRLVQAEAARIEAHEWLHRESVAPALTPTERALFDAASGAWPREAINDALWRKECLGTLLWGLQHLVGIPPYGEEFDQHVLDEAITRYGSVSSFRSNGALRAELEVDDAWMEADAWFGASEGRIGEDAALASMSAERYRALSWLRDAAAPTP